MEVLKDLRLGSVVANSDEGKRQRCNESESEVESDWESEARAIWVKDVVTDDDKGKRQTGRDERCNESEREAESSECDWESEARVCVLFERVIQCQSQNDAVAV